MSFCLQRIFYLKTHSSAVAFAWLRYLGLRLGLILGLGLGLGTLVPLTGCSFKEYLVVVVLSVGVQANKLCQPDQQSVCR